MADVAVTLGFLSASKDWGSHYDDFLKLVPPEIKVEIETLGLWRESLDELRGEEAVNTHIRKSAALFSERHWNAITLMGAPVQVENPDLVGKFRQAVNVPVTALESGAAALRALGARQALLLCPFNQRLKGMLRDYLGGEGIDAVLPEITFESIEVASSTSGDEVYEITKQAMEDAPGVHAIYFQGARLNPLPVLEKIEADFGLPVVASNPAMLWHTASLAGHKSSVPTGGGRLLRTWPERVPA